MTEDTLQRIDMCVFEGIFSCCDTKHPQATTCDRELLKTPILGVYFAFLGSMCAPARGEGREEDPSFAWVRQFIDHNIDRMFLASIDFAKCTPRTLTVSVERRELFGVLLKMMAGVTCEGSSRLEALHRDLLESVPQSIRGRC